MQEKNKLTIKEIARLAEVSPSAVSFALNGKKGISEQTRKHILDIVEQTNYRASLSGKKRSFTIAIIFRQELQALDQLFYTDLNASIISALGNLPYNLMLAPVYRDDDQIVLSDVLYSGSVDGILVYGDIENDLMNELKKRGIPIVVLDSSRMDGPQLAVRVNYAAAAHIAATYLIELGHRDIAYIGNDEKNLREFNQLTFSGFQAATAEHGIALATNRIQFNMSDENSLFSCIDNALAGAKQPTALFCATDFYAIHAMRYLYSKNLRVPQDISVIGIDDVAISKYTIPSLTTVHIDLTEMGRLGFDLLQKSISHEPCESVVLPAYRLVVRESTAPPPASDA